MSTKQQTTIRLKSTMSFHGMRCRGTISVTGNIFAPSRRRHTFSRLTRHTPRNIGRSILGVAEHLQCGGAGRFNHKKEHYGRWHFATVGSMCKSRNTLHHRSAEVCLHHQPLGRVGTLKRRDQTCLERIAPTIF